MVETRISNEMLTSISSRRAFCDYRGLVPVEKVKYHNINPFMTIKTELKSYYISKVAMQTDLSKDIHIPILCTNVHRNISSEDLRACMARPAFYHTITHTSCSI